MKNFKDKFQQKNLSVAPGVESSIQSQIIFEFILARIMHLFPTILRSLVLNSNPLFTV